MIRKVFLSIAVVSAAVISGCNTGASNELPVPLVSVINGGTSAVSPQFAALGGAVPAGVQVTFIGDVVKLRGENFRRGMRVFLGMNNQIARRPNSLLTTTRHLLPGDPFVFTDPVSGQQTILEVEAPMEFSSQLEVLITIPEAVACNPAFTNPVVRLFGDAGSSFPIMDVYFIVGPRCVATTPNKGVDIGGFDVIVHGDFFSPQTQIGFRYVDPADNVTKTMGDTAANDIAELFIDRHTLVIPTWPGIVPNSTFGLAKELKIDVLIFENIDAITGNSALEPGLGGVSPCSALSLESPEVPLVLNGVRNSEKTGAFTFLPTGVTDYPSIAGIVPESGPEIGGNTVIIHGDQFDAFTADLSNASDPGTGIECPPGSGNYIPPLKAVLVDRQTLAIVMPPCSVDIPEKVNFCLKNKFSIDNPVFTNDGQGLTATPQSGGTCVVFDDLYTYIPIPPILPPVVTAIHPAGPGPQPQGLGHDFGLERFIVVGDWFDADTTLNGGFEFLLPDGQVVQSLRTILHNRNLIEIFTKRLPEPFYPLSEDLTVDIRVRNVVGHADFTNAFVFQATPDAGTPPSITALCPTSGPFSGGNEVLVFGSDFDTTTAIHFDGVPATDVQFVHAGLLIVKAPPSKDAGGPDLPVPVTAVDDSDESSPVPYTYTEEPDSAGSCPTLGSLVPDRGSETGGYDILAYGINLNPLTRVEFGVDLQANLRSGNFSPKVFFLSSNLVLVEVPEAFPDQIGATIGVGASDPLAGCPDPIKTVDFTYLPRSDCDALLEIFFVDTTVEVPVTPTSFPALHVGGGDRMLVIGRCFNQRTSFDITKPQGDGSSSNTTSVTVLTPNIAVMTSPASPDGLPGLADLVAHNPSASSPEFTVEYVEPPPPTILDVRNLDDGTTTAPIDGNDRLIIFGDNFFAPLTVRLTGCDLNNQPNEITITLQSPNVTLVEDHLIGVNVPPNTFCEGPLEVEVETPFGTDSFVNEGGDPIFMLLGPQPPLVTGVFESKFNSNGGEEAVFFGRNFTASTQFSVRTDLMTPGLFIPVLESRFVSETVALVTMPALPGGMPPAGVPGDVRAEETSPVLISKIAGDPFTVAVALFNVCNDNAPVLLAVHEDHGSIDGGEQVLLIGANFLTATGQSNVDDVKFFDSGTAVEVGDYVQVGVVDLPLDSLDPTNRGKFHVINDHLIVLITNPHDPIAPEDVGAPIDVVIESSNGNTMLNGGYTYLNTPAVRTPFLLGITPNETRLNGGTSHLLSGGFLTEADRIVFTKGSTTFTIPLDGGAFSEVNDNFLVFVMPDLTGVFVAGDVVDVHAEKDVDGSTLVSNTMLQSLKITFAGPPTITPTLSPGMGSAFGGDLVEITGTFFTSNSQVLFGTLPARNVVLHSPTKLIVVTPSLPVDLPSPGIDLQNITLANGTVDVAVFTQGGWAVLNNGYQFKPATPVVLACDTTDVAEGSTVRINVTGDFFVPGDTTATVPPGDGTISDVQVFDFSHLSFEYAAPNPAAVLGPVPVSITIATTQGGPAAGTCDLDIHIDPVLGDCTTSYSLNDHAAPTVGVEGGSLVKVTLKGKNLLPGGRLVMQVDGNIAPVTLTEVGAFTGSGQFMVDDSETITFTTPNIFNQNTPTLLDGNPNIGAAAIEYTSPFSRSASLEDCFRYVPTLLDFQSYAFVAPTVSPVNTLLNTLTAGDVNQDGVADTVVLARQTKDVQNSNAFTAPDGFVFFADTFGAGIDINGDGIAPDFAGTFTKKVIANDNARVHLYIHGRGGIPRLANLDGDDDLEIILPVQDKTSGDAAVLIVDVNDDGTLGSETILVPSSISGTKAVSGIAVGNFDSSNSGVDIAITIGASAKSDRKIVVFKSTATAFVFTDSVTDIVADFDEVGFLASGDFDDDGDDDLVFGRSGTGNGRITIAKIDAAAGTIPTQTKITNVSGGACRSIVVFDADGDGKDDIFVNFQDASSGTLVSPDKFAGVAAILDPFDFLADSFHPTGFVKSGRALARGDYNGDGNDDIAVTSSSGETIVLLGDGAGGFVNSGRSWTLPTVPGFVSSRVHGSTAADMNRDGLAEILVGDIGANPMSLIVWLNTSR